MSWTPSYQEMYASCEACEKGDWRVLLWSTNPIIKSGYWYIRNIQTGTLKMVGKVTGKGKNWYDESHRICHERNKAL